MPPIGFVQDTFSLLDGMEGFKDRATLMTEVLRLTAKVGLDHLIAMRMPQPHQEIGPHVLLKHWPDPWLTHYDRKNLFRIDPVSIRCRGSSDPFVWSDLEVEARSAGERVMIEAREHGLGDGLTIPLFDADGFAGGVSMSGRYAELPSEVRRSLHMVGLYAFGTADRLARERPCRRTRLLTSREREMLRWAALGKTAWEIGEITCVSERTVIAHLANARTKLAASNTTQSVVEALRRREITL